MFSESNATKGYLEEQGDDDQSRLIEFGMIIYLSSYIAGFDIIFILDCTPEC